MYIVSFHPRFNESAHFLSKRLNIPYILQLSPKEGDTIIIFGSNEKADQLLYIQDSLKLKYLIIQSEPYHSDVFDNKYYNRLIHQNPLLDYSRYNTQYIKDRIPVKVYSFYFYEFVLHKEADEKARPYDILLLGNAKRGEEYKRLNPMCKYAPETNDVQVLLQHLKETKYVLIMPTTDKDPFDLYHVHRALTAGCQVVCQRGADTQTEKKYASYIHLEQNILDFSWLLEKEPTQTYGQLMEEFGYFEIETNLKQILFAARTLISPISILNASTAVVDAKSDAKPDPKPSEPIHKIEEEVIRQEKKKNGDPPLQMQPPVERARSELRSDPPVRRVGTSHYGI
jgi:hypothetical protein